MIVRTNSTEAFACYEKSCAPPPAGRGGSSKGSGKKPPAGYKSWGEYTRAKGRVRNAEVKASSKYQSKSSPYGDFEP
jgi:hypothetical protein